MCIPNPFTTTQNEDTIDSNRYKQNIHTGDGSNAECMGKNSQDLKKFKSYKILRAFQQILC